jgi:hypothetical protein
MKIRSLVLVLLTAIAALLCILERQHGSDMDRERQMIEKITVRDAMIQSLKDELAQKPYYRFYGYDAVYGKYDIRSFDRLTWYMVDPMIFDINKKAVINYLADEHWPDWRHSPKIQEELQENPDLKGLPETLSRLTEYQKEVADRVKFALPETNQIPIVRQ